MYKSALAGLFLCVLVIGTTSSSSVSANALDIEIISDSQQPLTEVLQESVDTDKEKKAETPQQPQTISYAVQPEDSLSKIAANHKTTWKRLYDKNTSIADPNIITVGQTVVVPTADEVLTERSLPQPAPQPVVAPERATTSKPKSAPRAASNYSAPRGSSAGNRYTAGYCTWYVKNMRPDLPNNLGNADTWASRAAAQGMATGSTPRAGAVGQRGMHVVYVESVNSDGTVTISEMNHKGLYVRTVRTLPASYFTYIY